MVMASGDKNAVIVRNHSNFQQTIVQCNTTVAQLVRMEHFLQFGSDHIMVNKIYRRNHWHSGELKNLGYRCVLHCYCSTRVHSAWIARKARSIVLSKSSSLLSGFIEVCKQTLLAGKNIQLENHSPQAPESLPVSRVSAGLDSEWSHSSNLLWKSVSTARENEGDSNADSQRRAKRMPVIYRRTIHDLVTYNPT